MSCRYPLSHRFSHVLDGDDSPVSEGLEKRHLANKELGTTMLITEAAYQAAGLDMRVSDRGLVDVKGRQDPVRIYEVPALSLDETAG